MRVFVLALCLLANPYIGFSQLDNFILNLSHTDETCLGNGTISFSVSNTTEGAAISYAVYLLPNTTSPIAVTTSGSVSGLNAGNYQVVATQTMGSSSGSQEGSVTIMNLIQNLVYTVQSQNERCGNDGQITVNVTSGIAVSYQILSGPVTTPLQPGNVFTGLPSGVYQIRVYNNCGEGVVQTHTVSQDNVGLVIDAGVVASTELPSCNTVSVLNYAGALSGSVIANPLNVQHTVFPPGGGTPVVFNQVVNGPTSVVQEIPLFMGQSYTYTIQITDACGDVYTRTNTVDIDFDVNLSYGVLDCDYMFLKINPLYYVSPYTIQFLEYPSGFNPNTFNASHPGPFTAEEVTYGGEGFILPEGLYTIQLTDSCGRTKTASTTVEIDLPVPVASGSTSGCNGIFIGFASEYMDIVTVIVTGAPADYEGTLPDDISALIIDGELFITNIPSGTYTFEVTDSCGIIHNLTTSVVTDSAPLGAIQRPGCDLGHGGIRVTGTVPFETVFITAAPEDFSGTLPFDLSDSISGTEFAIGNVPGGNYTFLTTNACGVERTDTFSITPYQITTNNLVVTENCGSFNLLLQHISNGTNTQRFWLQKYYPDSDHWGHPLTGQPYTEGTNPNMTNSYPLTVNVNNLNIASSGQFRVLKRFIVIGDDGVNTDCISVLHEFEFTGGPKITNVYSFSCSGGTSEVIVEATGLPPLMYRITSKNGEPFLIDNGLSNIFNGIETAIYNFQVEDACGNIVNSLFDVAALPEIAITATDLCDGTAGNLSVPNYSFLSYEWWREDAPEVILSSSFTLEFEPFSLPSDLGTYYVHIVSSVPNSCINETLSFTIDGGLASPNAGENIQVQFCWQEGSLELLSLQPETVDTHGVWEDMSNSGALNGGEVLLDMLSPGIYEYQYTVHGFCNTTDESVVTIQVFDYPEAPEISATNQICANETIELSTPQIPGATYEWWGPGGFTSNEPEIVISNAQAVHEGIYYLKVTVNGCDSDTVEASVEVKFNPQFEIEGGNVFLCENQSTELYILPSNFDWDQEVEIVWYHNGHAIDFTGHPDLQVFDTGVYTASVTLNGCEFSQSIEVFENTEEIPIILETACINNQYIIYLVNVEDFGTAAFEWIGPNGFSGSDISIDITDQSIGTYTLTVTTEDGCTFEESITVTRSRCSIPKGISPNNDGINDSFDLTGYDVKKIKIFNRYGRMVYELNDYVDQWRGQAINGQILPAATYYYVLFFGDGSERTGWVYLQREE